MRPRREFHAKNRSTPVLILPGCFFSSVLAALANQTIKPRAQVIGDHLRCDSLNKCDERHGSTSFPRQGDRRRAAGIV